MPAAEVTLEIVKGDTFIQFFRWEDEGWLVAPIQSISYGASALITLATPVSIPPEWRACVVDARVVGGQAFTQLNAQKDSETLEPLEESLRPVRVISSTELELNGVSTALMKQHLAGSGYLMWHPPVDLTGFTARMSIKNGTTLLLSSLKAVPDITLTINETEFWTKALINDADTAAMAKGGRFDLEMIAPTTLYVEKTFKGAVTLATEITTPIT